MNTVADLIAYLQTLPGDLIVGVNTEEWGFCSLAPHIADYYLDASMNKTRVLDLNYDDTDEDDDDAV